jgi:hypothetical protein
MSYMAIKGRATIIQPSHSPGSALRLPNRDELEPAASALQWAEPWLRSDADWNGDEGRPALDVKQLAAALIAYPPDTGSPSAAPDGGQSTASEPVWVRPAAGNEWAAQSDD